MADVVLAAATVFAVVAVATSLPSLLRADARERAGTRLMPSLVMLTGAAAITFAAWLAFDVRCGHRCDRGPGPDGIDSLHRWWHRHDSWQWGAELALAGAGLAVAALAFAMAARGMRRARALLWTARLAYLAWIALVFGAPAVYELLNR